jgi:hypothetical protein
MAINLPRGVGESFEVGVDDIGPQSFEGLVALLLN